MSDPICRIKVAHVRLTRSPGGEWSLYPELYLAVESGDLVGRLSHPLEQGIEWGEVNKIVGSLIEAIEERATQAIFETADKEEVESV